MEAVFSERFKRSLQEAPESIQFAFEKQLGHLLRDMRHPSLRIKKYREAQDIWQARVNRTWRFYFQIKRNTYYFVDIMSHPK